ncbi:MAG: ABC transporter [Candidatus Rokubacteria bacterium RIFCSPLOWO2_12_FULL_71_19]|nr:MAG: ABC transporter [Candidatus Rokubacteria bacterium RIFCSPLOWO2_12_FULL_71_19]
MSVVEGRGLTKVFGAGEGAVTALRDAAIEVDAGELVAIMGPSGSGKTTLLRALSLIDPPTAGDISFGGERVCAGGRVLTDDRKLRLTRMGIIFQAYNLIPFLTTLENVALPLVLAGAPNAVAFRGARLLLEGLDLAGRAGVHPATLSGGEQQRVAVARAVVNDPAVILADEPTAALDTERGRAVMELLRRLGRERGAAVIVVTHDERMIEGFDRVYHMTDGRIRTARGGGDPAAAVV